MRSSPGRQILRRLRSLSPENFWSSPSDSPSSPPPPPPPAPPPPREAPTGAYLLGDVAGWGAKRKIRYVDRHLEGPPSNPPPSTRKRIKNPNVKAEAEEQPRRAPRWSEERYEGAERKLAEVMREMGAGLGDPMPRQALREAARKRIGDTGLLDHLLKHMVGKVVPGGGERLRRRHNEVGELEYWLEPVDAEDTASACPCSSECRHEMGRLRQEVASLKRVIEQLKADNRRRGIGGETNGGAHEDGSGFAGAFC